MGAEKESEATEGTENNLISPQNDSKLAATDDDSPEKKLPYPKSVFFIVSNEFCERFSYYGMRTILVFYLVDILFYKESEATIIYHTFTMFVYFFPIFGAILSDSWLGKFRTILYVSCIYAAGNIVLALTATPPLNFPAREISIVGLLLIALGTGGIKPCVSAFGGDQFILPQQERQLATFFSLFYFSINSGSLLSTIITPILREDVKCFDMDSCYSIAFAIPGMLMVVSIIIFAIGKPLYRIRQPSGNMLVRVSKCVGNAISTKIKSKEKKDHWLEYAEPAYGKDLVQDVQALFKVLVLYIPLPVFWALFDQQGSGWTFMARRMNGDIGFMTILPDQMQVINPLLILIFIPLFQYAIYPLLTKCKILRTPLQRLVAGGCLASISFIISAILSLALEATFPVLPGAGNGQLRVYNALDQTIKLNGPFTPSEASIMPLSMFKNISIDVDNNVSLPYTYTCGGLPPKQANFIIHEKKSMAYYFTSCGPAMGIEDEVDKNFKGNPTFRNIIKSNTVVDVKYRDENGVVKFNEKSTNTTLVDVRPGVYKIYFDEKLVAEHKLELGGVYTFIANNKNVVVKSELIVVTKANSLSIFLLLPQYIVITMGEIMFSITGLEFAYSQAPLSMKSVLQACWLLTTAFGNLIVVIVESIEPFEDKSKTFFLYAGLLLVDMAIFSLMAMRYKYVKKDEEEESLTLPETKQNGIDNGGFKNNDDS